VVTQRPHCSHYFLMRKAKISGGPTDRGTSTPRDRIGMTRPDLAPISRARERVLCPPTLHVFRGALQH
jgi:hypothetical protein